MRRQLMLDPDPLARLQPRNLPPPDGRALVAKAANLAPKIPQPLFDLVLRHPIDKIERSDVLACCTPDGRVEAPPPPPTARRSSLVMK